MKLDVQKRIAAKVLGCSPKRVVFDQARLTEIKEAITKADVRALIIDKFVYKKQKKGVSGSRAKKIKIQKTKGKRKGHGSRKGRAKARTPKKMEWMNRIRLQREVLRNLREKKLIDNETFWSLYKKCKGGFFRSKRHLKLYIEEQELIKESKKETKKEEKPKEKAAKSAKPAKSKK